MLSPWGVPVDDKVARTARDATPISAILLPRIAVQFRRTGILLISILPHGHENMETSRMPNHGYGLVSIPACAAAVESILTRAARMISNRRGLADASRGVPLCSRR